MQNFEKFLKVCISFLFISLCLGGGENLSFAEEKDLNNTGKITLEEAIDSALKNNLQLLSKQRKLGVVQARFTQAKLWLNPEFEYEAATDSVGYQEGQERYSFELSQEFSLGPKRRYRIQIAQQEIERFKFQIKDLEQDVIRQVQETFFRLILLREKLFFMEEMVKINKELVGVTQAKFRDGFIPELEVNFVIIGLQETLKDRAELKNEAKVTEMELNRLLGRDIEASVAPEGELEYEIYNFDLASLKRTALENRADLKEIEILKEIAKKNISLNKSKIIPNITLSVIYEKERAPFEVDERKFSDADELIGGKVSIPLPLFDRQQAEIAASRALRDSMKIDVQAMKRTVEKDVRASFNDFNLAKDTLEIFEKDIIRLVEANLELSKSAYLQGQAGILEVLKAQEKFMEKKNEYLEAIFEYNLSLAKLERALGTELRDL